MQPFKNFYLNFKRRPQARPALPAAPCPDAFISYFQERGISAEYYLADHILPLTPNPSPEECERFKASMRSNRKNKESGSPWIVSGILFEYPCCKEKFGASRGFEYSETFRKLFDDEKPPKMLVPKKERVQSGQHLYYLPDDERKLNKQTVALNLIEGQGKTLKLMQDFKTAGISEENAVIGLQGVDNFIGCPETQDIQWRNRYVFIWFDADSKEKPSVAHAEIKIAAYLLSKGARVVKSCCWDKKRGNGYDDHSVFALSKGFPPKDNLKMILSKAKETFRKYAPDDDADGLPLETFCRAIAKVPGIDKHGRGEILLKLEKCFKPLGSKSADIKDALESEIKYEEGQKQEELIQANAEFVQQLFGVSYTPNMPSDYFLKNGHLCYNEAPLCRPFIIKQYIAAENQDKPSFLVARFQHGETLISTDEYSNYRHIAQIFNRRQEILCDESARHVQRYIAHYWIRNKEYIPVVPLFENTGWDKTGEFRLPTLDAESVYAPHIKDAFQTHGDADAQREFLRGIMTEHPAALIVLLGYATPLIGLFNLKPCITMIYGGAGDGKSTAAFLPLSLYGDYRKLFQTMNATKVGKEIAFSMNKDLPCLFDEMNTAGNGDGVTLAKTLIETIYGFYSGKGRTRGTVNLALSHQAEYQGLLMLTSERSLESIFSVIPNISVAGAYRRTLEISVLDRHTLWKYDDADSSSFFARTYKNLSEHYGHAGKEWLDYLSSPEKQDDIKRRYETLLEQESGDRDLKGTENLIALLAAIIPDVESVLHLPNGTILNNIEVLFKQVIDAQKKQIARQIQDISQKFEDALNSFIAGNVSSFDGVCPPEIAMTKVFGAVKDITNDDGEERRHVFLRPEALAKLCNDYGFDRSGLLTRLKDTGIFQPCPRNKVNADGEILKDKDGHTIVEEIDYKSMRIRGTGGNAYHFVVNIDFAEWNAEVAETKHPAPETPAPQIPAQEKIF